MVVVKLFYLKEVEREGEKKIWFVFIMKINMVIEANVLSQESYYDHYVYMKYSIVQTIYFQWNQFNVIKLNHLHNFRIQFQYLFSIK